MFPLVRYFSIASALIIIVATVAVSTVVTDVITQQLLQEREAANVSFSKSFSNSVWPSYRDHIEAAAETDSRTLRASPATVGLDGAVRALMSGYSVVRVRVEAPSGVTVYSTEAGQIGEDRGQSPAFQAARGGKVSTDITLRERFNGYQGPIVDAYIAASSVPLRDPAGEVTAVLEIYDDVTGTVVRMRDERNRVITVVCGLFVALYLVLLLIVRQAREIMRRQHDALAEAKAAVEHSNRELAEENRLREEAQEELQRTNEMLVARSRELQTAQDTLVQKERLATLGQLIATVSHELRNPMGAIRSSLYVVRQKTDDMGLGLERTLDRADRNILRCDNIISELLDFTRDLPPKMEPAKLDDWLRQTLAEQSAPDTIEVVLALNAPEVELPFDHERLRRAVINVFDNANQAMTENAPDAQRRLSIGSRVHDGRYEMIFEDTGPGMDEKTLARIFEPFFSTKSFGTGLGMPTVKKILETHGGGIHYDSTPGEGTKVTLWLPLDLAQREAA